MDYVYIGNVRIEKSCALSPMASVADRAYRTVCRRFGASLLTSEMVSAKGLCYSSAKTNALCEVTPDQRPYAVQIFSEDSKSTADAVKIVNRYKPDIIDINMGCPVPKVVNSGAGSALMKNPPLASDIVKAACDAADCPVTVKIRSGWDSDSINAVEFAGLMERSGAAAVAVHPRTRKQMYSGSADWQIIKAVKQAVGIPVIGNGDIKSGEDCKRMYDVTGCDLCSLARASYGRPWVFREIRDYLYGGIAPEEPTVEQKMEIMLYHISLLVELKGEDTGIKEARKNAAWYFKGLKDAASLRKRAGELSSLAELEKMADEAIRSHADV